MLKIRVCDKRETVRELRRRELFFTSALHGSLVDKEHSLSHEKLEMLICNIPGSPQRLPYYPPQSDPRRPNSFATRLCRCFALGHPAKLYRNALFPPHGILHYLSCCAKKQFYMFQSMTAVLLLRSFNHPLIAHLCIGYCNECMRGSCTSLSRFPCHFCWGSIPETGRGSHF